MRHEHSNKIIDFEVGRMITKNNHYIPQWHQKGFMSDRDDQLCYL